MSGPKLSEAELERLRLEQLERERQEALRRLKEAQTVYSDACKKAAALEAYARNGLLAIDPLYRVEAKRQMKEILSFLSIDAVSDTKDPECYHQAAQSILNKVEQVSQKAEALLNKQGSRAAADRKLQDSDTAHQTFQVFAACKDDLIAVTKIDFLGHADQKALETQIDMLYQHFLPISQLSDIPARRALAQKAVIDLKTLKTDAGNSAKQADIRSRLQKLVNEEAEIIRVWKEFQDLYKDYQALSVMIDRTPKDPRDFSDAAALEKEIEELSMQYRKKDEMDYIADQINSVMVDLGYGLVSSQVLTRKDRSEVDCSLYQADEETGVAVYTDQSGAVMMRMTVLGEDQNITQEDRDFSYQRQIDFCAGHQDLVDALAKRGVYLKQVSYMEPDKKHTYKVNIGDNQTAKQKDANGQSVMNRQKVNRRKRRRAGGKKVRAM